MRFWQKYSYDEDGFGEQYILFAVTDTYSELFSSPYSSGEEVDIFMLESVKQDLNTDEGSFAVDELAFVIDEGACDTDIARNALFFTLEAADVNNPRYCAIFFAATPSVADQLFVGKIQTKISGSDKKWTSSAWSGSINPTREYKFAALSFDISILDECKMNDEIIAPDGSNVDNIFKRFEDESYSSIQAICANKFSHHYYESGSPAYNYYTPYICNLYSALSAILTKASLIASSLTGLSMTISLTESDVGVTAVRAYYLIDSDIPDIIGVYPALSSPQKIKINSAEGGADWKSAYISRKFIDPKIGNDETYEWQTRIINADTPASWRGLDSVGELIHEIARAFGCYAVISNSTAANFAIEFVPRAAIIDSGNTYLYGATEAGFDTSNVAEEAEQAYWGTTTVKSTGWHDTLIATRVESGSILHEINDDSDNLKAKKLQIETAEARENREYTKLLLTSGNVLVQNASSGRRINLNGCESAYPWNAKFETGALTAERLYSGFYFRDTPITGGVYDAAPAGTTIWRPATAVMAKIDGENKWFETLADYISYLGSRDKSFYETEYELTAPYWNGFSANADGSSASWDLIKLGSKIQLSETVRQYSGGAWSNQTVSRDYVVVGIERSLHKPETKLKLQNTSRFAFGDYDGDGSELPDDNVIGDGGIVPGVISEIFEADDTILKGDAVQIKSNGKLMKAVSDSSSAGKTIGIALHSAASGDECAIQVSGRVEIGEYSLTSLGDYAYVRTPADPSADLNISQTILNAATAGEDMIILLGVADSSDSFVLEIREYVYD